MVGDQIEFLGALTDTDAETGTTDADSSESDSSEEEATDETPSTSDVSSSCLEEEEGVTST